MDPNEAIELLESLIEGMLDPDSNDLDAYGMDAMTQKRLRVKKLHKPKSAKKASKPISNHMPYGLGKV